MKQRKTTAVIIPTYKPDYSFSTLLDRLYRQTIQPDRILIINTEEGFFPKDITKQFPELEVMHIRKEEFDHGGTRNRAAMNCFEDILIFMTQDVLPADPFLVERLTEVFEDPSVKAAYARQVPKKDADCIERFVRRFNYGEESKKKTKADLPYLGIKTFFCSDACAAYEGSWFRERRGFCAPAIYNEDMVYASGVIHNGFAIAYAAQAKVFHSHNYSAATQFHRNFDLGVSQAQHPEVFDGVFSEGEGIRMVKACSQYLVQQHQAWSIPKLIWQSGWKYLGYQLGRHYKMLPARLVKCCTWSPEFWNK